MLVFSFALLLFFSFIFSFLFGVHVFPPSLSVLFIISVTLVVHPFILLRFHVSFPHSLQLVASAESLDFFLSQFVCVYGAYTIDESSSFVFSLYFFFTLNFPLSISFFLRLALFRFPFITFGFNYLCFFLFTASFHSIRMLVLGSQLLLVLNVRLDLNKCKPI